MNLFALTRRVDSNYVRVVSIANCLELIFSRLYYFTARKGNAFVLVYFKF